MSRENCWQNAYLKVLSRFQRSNLNFWSNSDGVAATEFALVSPILVILALGVIDVGNAVSENFDLKAAARVGAEYAVANRNDTAGIRQAVLNATNIDTDSLAVTSEVFCECSYQSAATCGEVCPNEEDAAPRQFVTVTVTDSYSPLFLPNADEDEEESYAIFKSITHLEAAVTLRIE